MDAIVTKAGRLAKEKIPVPEPADNQALVKISYVAQNPTDVKSLDSNVYGDGAVLGCDFVGAVEKIGSKVTRVKVGDIVAGLIRGGEIPGLGGYSQYTVADERICFHVPAAITPAEAATIPLAALTALLALFSKRCLGIDKGEGGPILVWGGSSSVGLYAIQIAKLYGFSVVTVCSPRNYETVRSLGADHVFDYRDPDVIEKIRKAAPGLKYAFDTIGDEKSSETASQAIAEQGGGGLCTVRPDKAFTDNVPSHTKVSDVLVWTAFLKEQRWSTFHWPPSQHDHDLCAEFMEQLPKLLEEGRIRPNQAKVYQNGLDDVSKGFQEFRDGKVSNYKIVYKV